MRRGFPLSCRYGTWRDFCPMPSRRFLTCTKSSSLRRHRRMTRSVWRTSLPAAGGACCGGRLGTRTSERSKHRSPPSDRRRHRLQRCRRHLAARASSICSWRASTPSPAVDVVAGLVTYFDALDQGSPCACADLPHRDDILSSCGSGSLSAVRCSTVSACSTSRSSMLRTETFCCAIIENDVPFVVLNATTLYYRRHDNSMMTRDHPRRSE